MAVCCVGAGSMSAVGNYEPAAFTSAALMFRGLSFKATKAAAHKAKPGLTATLAQA